MPNSTLQKKDILQNDDFDVIKNEIDHVINHD